VFGQLANRADGQLRVHSTCWRSVLCLSLLDDDAARAGAAAPARGWRPGARLETVPPSAGSRRCSGCSGAGLRARDPTDAARHGGGGANPLLDVVAPLRSVNGYGLFRVMTTERFEIVIEGGADTVHWREYQFRWKPGDPARRPPFVGAAHAAARLANVVRGAQSGGRPGLARGPCCGTCSRGHPRCLTCSARNPFPSGPPDYVRFGLLQYRFSTPTERARDGAWWQRERVGYLTEPLY